MDVTALRVFLNVLSLRILSPVLIKKKKIPLIKKILNAKLGNSVHK